MSLDSFRFEAIGTHWQFDLDLQDSKVPVQEIQTSVSKLVEKFDKNYSRFRKDSFVYHLYTHPGDYELPKDAKPLLDLYEKLYLLTDGVFTPLIGDLLIDAGYDELYSLKPGKLNKPKAWSDVIEYKYPNIYLKQKSMLDFGAAGKGFLIDQIASLLRSRGIQNFIVDGSGDMCYQNFQSDSIKVGLENPVDTSQVIGVLKLNSGQCLASSAGNRRAWSGFHHIINPDTLISPNHVLATWVVASSTLLADALATALVLLPAENFTGHFEFEYVILYADMTFSKSENCEAQIFFT